MVMDDEDQGTAPKRRARRVEQTPVQRALGLLVRREHSRLELTRKLAAELEDTMEMCGAHTLAEITRDMVRL